MYVTVNSSLHRQAPIDNCGVILVDLWLYIDLCKLLRIKWLGIHLGVYRSTTIWNKSDWPSGIANNEQMYSLCFADQCLLFQQFRLVSSARWIGLCPLPAHSNGSVISYSRIGTRWRYRSFSSHISIDVNTAYFEYFHGIFTKLKFNHICIFLIST